MNTILCIIHSALLVVLTVCTVLFSNPKGGGGLGAEASYVLNQAVGSKHSLTSSRVAIFVIFALIVLINTANMYIQQEIINSKRSAEMILNALQTHSDT